MKIARFLFAAAAGGAIVYWLLFLFVAGAMAGEIYWMGFDHGVFIPGYLVSLYLPLSLAGVFAFLALRRPSSNA